MVPYFTRVGDDAAPSLGFILHGVLGAGHNLRSFAKRVTEQRPDVQFLLLDLRHHGRSLGAPPPYGLEACVDDLFDLVDDLGRAPRVVIGHSLGGKVALSYARRHESPKPGERLPGAFHQGTLAQVWTLDSDPGAQEPGGAHEVQRVLAALKAHPGPFPSRQHAIDAIMSEGRSSGLAQWLATSLDRREGAFVWRFEIDQIELLLADYFSIDEWPFLEGLERRRADSNILYDLLLAENSDRWSGSMVDRAQRLTGMDRVRVHTLPDAGHWVHVDNPDGLVEIVSSHLINPM